MTDSQQDMQKQEACATAPDGDAPKKVNVALRVYGVLMMLMGILDMVVFLSIGALLGLALYFSTMSPGSPECSTPCSPRRSETRPRSRWRSWRCPCASTPRSPPSARTPGAPSSSRTSRTRRQAWMAARFESMTIEPQNSTRLDNALREATSVEAVDGELEEDASVADAATTATEATATAETATA